jgi:hypothetical protein
MKKRKKASEDAMIRIKTKVKEYMTQLRADLNLIVDDLFREGISFD